MLEVDMRSDRLSSYRQWNLDWQAALELETRLGVETIRSGETLEGAQRFSDGAGRPVVSNRQRPSNRSLVLRL